MPVAWETDVYTQLPPESDPWLRWPASILYRDGSSSRAIRNYRHLSCGHTDRRWGVEKDKWWKGFDEIGSVEGKLDVVRDVAGGI